MKIVHLCLSNFYIEGFGYQENIIPKYHKKFGHDVTIIASRFTYRKDNGEEDLAESGKYINSDGIKVIRIDYKNKWLGKINKKLKIYKDTYKLLEKEQPDLIFNHGIQFLDLIEVARYVEDNPHCKLIVDNHAAYINSGKNFISREILHKVIYKWAIQKSLPFIEKVFVLAPGCRKFVKDMYNISDEKMEYLYLGADTDKIDFENQDEIKMKIRKNLSILDDDFVIITGGKLSKRKNIKLLLNSMKKVDSNKLKLLIFGSFSDDIKQEMLSLIESDNRVNYIGWLSGEDVYDYYLASNAAVFPGSKSALWEQAICSGLPLICKRWDGMEYVDVGGNCLFLDGDNSHQLKENIKLLMDDKTLYENMEKVAKTKGYITFSYEKIARQAIRIN
ncbi:glycosyltransferase family 4 protein [Filibacter tadaridae]|uniref:N-acetylgalactosamine-N, N'-diacetylbacillosaminyl-diphospho-undecaprenol 4-alpha-N-acetylgalactosaminyltransferase n=1 Tax=Filibacter tadaridae TaxID=2483811 RepID=A0A3P5XG07_9BACL|nr:glycosyltransferase family 4 protein [Filibacter tadaridae]VDC33692.1 N-acetylgalactosamine-N, N'-diacetylbacillosaminyl-diphospho-undecaprenol 4-alpha-N-acetylgalactosaminyltransferase [Filibacter tadaridae]